MLGFPCEYTRTYICIQGMCALYTPELMPSEFIKSELQLHTPSVHQFTLYKLHYFLKILCNCTMGAHRHGQGGHLHPIEGSTYPREG